MAIDILIAEDEPSILEALSFVLQRAGWTISAVMDGDAVMDAVRSKRPRMVLDVMMPKRSGFEVLKQIRAEDGTRTLPVLVLTAKGQNQADRRIAEELGANSFITKPYANTDVADAVRALIGAPVAPEER